VAQTGGKGSWRRSRQLVNGVFALALLMLVACVLRAGYVRQAYGAWGLWPGQGTPRIPFHGRTYLRANGTLALPDGAVVLGSAPGRGRILSSPPIADYAPTVLFIRYPDGAVTVYTLSGGP
jgi:hypothetical protein